MLDYSTCLKLKEAGFPQFGDGFALALDVSLPELDQTVARITWDRYVYIGAPRPAIYEPTLEELIEACGDVTIWKKNDKWHATGEKGLELLVEYNMVNWQMDVRDVEELNDRIFDGQTPIQAVANLYLALARSN